MPDTLPIRTFKRKNLKGLRIPQYTAALNNHNDAVDGQTKTPGTINTESVAVGFMLNLKPDDVLIRDALSEESKIVEHKGTGRLLCQKRFSAENRKERKNVIRELRVMASCTSDFILPYLGCTENPYCTEIILYTEYMNVGSLRRVIADFGPLRIDVLGKVAETVLSAVNYLYTNHRIIHRDLRPSRILVNSRGEIKVGGFGFSATLQNSVVETVASDGIERYLAPERILGEPHTIKSDMWSFGIILIELATGKHPMRTGSEDSVLDLLQRIIDEPSPILPDGEVFPASLHEMVDKCLLKEPGERPRPQELLDTDIFVQEAKRSNVDLREWAASVMKHNSMKRDELGSGNANVRAPPPMAPAIQEKYAKRPLEIDTFLSHLDRLVVLEQDGFSANQNLPLLCSDCKALLDSTDTLPGQSQGSIQGSQKPDMKPDCSLCHMLEDCSPQTPMAEGKPGADKHFILEVRPKMASVDLRVGQLSGFMSRVMSLASAVEDHNTGSDCAFQLGAAWITTCLKDHAKCNKSQKFELPVLPTRVIDVGSPDGSHGTRLHASNGERGLYFTLSYRWSDNNAAFFQTVKSRLESYQTSIPVEILPQTMKDAIHITRKFGVRYLWIDALCIAQDSPQDWHAEARDMARIYKNSMLTIAAAANRLQDADGCFRTRKRRQTRPLNGGRSWLDGSPKYIFADRRMTGGGTRPRSELDTRGWILQEQLLSPRVLSYTTDELFWDCVTLNASESFPDGIPEFYDVELLSLDTRLFKDAILHKDTHAPDQEVFYHLWKKVVEEYSGRNLTRLTDKLAALMGIAQEAAAILNDELHAGMWKSRLWRELLWWVKYPETTIRPQTFIAPSWSWASIHGAVSYDLPGGDREDALCSCVQVIDTVQQQDPLLSWMLLSSKVVVRGKVVPLLAKGQEENVSTGSSTRLSLPVWLEDSRGTHGDSVLCLIVAASKHYVYGLGLENGVGAQSDYRRVGMVYWRADPEVIGWDKTQRKWKGNVSIVDDTETLVIF